MTQAMSRWRRTTAALLALVLLALPGAPLRHAAGAAPLGLHGAAEHCGGHGTSAPADRAAVVADPHEHHQPCGGSGGASPGLVCCAAAQCPATLAAPPPIAVAPLLPPGPAPRAAPPVRDPRGIAIRPAIPPPRAVA
jgi:hypothetical protein